MLPDRLLTTIRYASETLLVKAAYGLLRLMPPALASTVGGWLGNLLGRYLSRTETARRNLRRAMPELTDVEIDRIIREMWNNIGRTFAEFPHIAATDSDVLHHIVEFEGLEHVRKANQSTTASLFFTAHLGNWECAAKSFSSHGYPLHIVYRKSNNPGLNKLIDSLRASYFGGFLPKGMDGSRKMVEALKTGGRIGMLVDQKMNDGINVPFFGSDVMTAPAIARLALKYKCPVLPVRVIRTDGIKHKIIVYPPLELPDTGDIHHDVYEIMSRINAIIEGWIRKYPGQWFWLHNRWPDANDEQKEQ